MRPTLNMCCYSKPAWRQRRRQPLPLLKSIIFHTCPTPREIRSGSGEVTSTPGTPAARAAHNIGQISAAAWTHRALCCDRAVQRKLHLSAIALPRSGAWTIGSGPRSNGVFQRLLPLLTGQGWLPPAACCCVDGPLCIARA